MATLKSSFRLKLIYVFRINDEKHKGCLKVGETQIEEEYADPLALTPNCTELNQVARKRIDEYTSTAGVDYELLHTELTCCLRKGYLSAFNDGEVHSVLKRSGVKQKTFTTEGGSKSREWFLADLETVKSAIRAAKEGRGALKTGEVSQGRTPITFRDEQKEAILKTLKRFKTNNQYLWNAKMRFGKTLCALEVVRRMDYGRTLILTHRPVVNEGWYEDFQKIFYSSDHYQYGSKSGKGEDFERLEEAYHKQGRHYVYFASMQDLRGSVQVGGIFEKNDKIFDVEWDLLVVDEAHEGTQTERGQAVINALFHGKTKKLDLSGTPFNLLEGYEEADIFTWDYVMEQRAKQEWDTAHPNDPNPYACLPRLNIYTYDLGMELRDYQDGDHAFNFAEFFRVEGSGEEEHFRHEDDVDCFLDLLTRAKDYPFSRPDWRGYFRHSLWTMPSVAAARCMSKKLSNHPVLGNFKVVNVAGDGDSDADYESSDALKKVREDIGDHPEETMTITLTRGRLTTGVTVKEWTAVFMLHGSHNTSASSYMQTIFRAQTPAIIGGRQKQECYVFDFAPDRTLKVLAETAKVSAKAGRTNENDRQLLGEFLNFCPVIAFEGAQMQAIDTPHMMQQLKRVYVERVVINGFEDKYLYNDRLMRLDQLELERFAKLRDLIGKTKAMKRTDEVVVNNQGLTDEQYEQAEAAEKKKREGRKLTPAELLLLRQLEEKKKQCNTAISILHGISIRMPMLLYGANIENEESELTIDNFTSLVDDLSWAEFMPQGVTKALFEDFKKYYDPDIFAASGKRIREQARLADQMDIEERIDQLVSIFATFRNPDKETVLTPWRVVNMQIGDTLGGWVFYDHEYKERMAEPHEVRHKRMTDSVFRRDAKVLEINSKSGLYPLFVAYSLYRGRIEAERLDWLSAESAEGEERLRHHQRIWDEVLRENIFVLCKTPMARLITIRTLAGFREGVRVHAHTIDDLVPQLRNDSRRLIAKLSSPSFWNYKSDDLMKFNAIVGNPPYQLMGGSGGTNDAPIYQLFCDMAIRLKPNFISLITPARWFSGGRENLLGDFRKTMLTSGCVRQLHVYTSSRDIFPNVEIKGGICFFLFDKNYRGNCRYSLTSNGEVVTSEISLQAFDVLIRNPRLNAIVQKIDGLCKEAGVKCVDTIISADTPFGIPTNPGKSSKTPFDIFDTKDKEHDTMVYYLDGNQRRTAYCRRADVRKNTQDIDAYKVFIPGAGGSGNDPYVLGKPEIAMPNSVCSQTYLYSAFKSELEARNFSLYLKSKFLRILVSAIKITQHAQSNAYRFVPLQDFTEESDIDWTAPIEGIDRQLYRKYHLTDEEQAFVESMIRPMK